MRKMKRGMLAVAAATALLIVSGAAPASAATSTGHTDSTAGVRIQEAGCLRGPVSYDIGPGSTGTAVQEVQCLLNRTLSWNVYPYVISVDGNYGPITTGAVRVFQTCANNRGAGIAVDGRVGPQTLPHLRWWGQYSYDTGVLMC